MSSENSLVTLVVVQFSWSNQGPENWKFADYGVGKLGDGAI